MNRKDFYFKQKVKASELDGAFDDVENAFGSFLEGFGYVGIAAGAEVGENSPANLTVVVSGPAIIWDQNQKRIGWTPDQVVNCALDENGSSTVVPSIGNSRWLSIFAEFDETLSDPRIDGNGDTVYFQRAEGFKINVVQGAEAPSNPPRPPLRGDQILLADVSLANGQTTIEDADVDTSRTELTYSLEGTPLSIKERGLQPALQAMADAINDFDASSVEADAVAGTPYSLASGTVDSQLAALVGFVNALAPLTIKCAVYDLGNATASGAVVALTEALDNGGFGLSANQVQVPDAGFYLIALSGSCQTSDTANPASAGAWARRVGDVTAIADWNPRRFSANSAHTVTGSAIGIAQITTPGTQKIELEANNDINNTFARLVIVRLGPP